MGQPTHEHTSHRLLSKPYNASFVVAFSYIKMSSPSLNNIIVVGCVFAYISVFLLGTDGGMVPPQRYHVMCAVSMDSHTHTHTHTHTDRQTHTHTHTQNTHTHTRAWNSAKAHKHVFYLKRLATQKEPSTLAVCSGCGLTLHDSEPKDH